MGVVEGIFCPSIHTGAANDFVSIYTDDFMCIGWNVRDIRSSIEELRILLKDQALDIFSISETWLNRKISDEELEIEGYNLLRKDRAYANGGSVVVYIKNR